MTSAHNNTSRKPECCACDSAEIVSSKYFGSRMLRCLNCGLHFINPTLEDITNSSDKLYSEKYDEYYMEKEKMRAAHTSNQIVMLSDEGRLSGTRLLDIGCGFGFFIKMMKEKGWEVYGCEQNHRAKEHAEEMSLTVYQDLKDQHLWRKDFFDVITLWNVLDLVDDPLNMLRDCIFLLREKGAIIVRVPNLSSLNLLRNIERLRGKDKAATIGNGIPFYSRNLYCFTAASLKFILERAGFTKTCLIPSPVGDLMNALRKAIGHKKAHIVARIAERLNTAIVQLSRSHSAGLLSITMIAYKPEIEK